MDSPYPVDLEQNLNIATNYMKILANKNRLLLMFKIIHKPYMVSELVALTGMSQTALSHQLARLREENMVIAEKKGKEIYYSIANNILRELIENISYKFQCW